MGKWGFSEIKEFILRVWRETNEDNIFSNAAALSYYFLLAFFPMLIFLTSLVGFLPGIRESIFTALANFVPGEAMGLVNDTIQDITKNKSGGLISFGVLGTLWAASGGVSALMSTLNVAYDAEEKRSFWKVRLMAIGLTVMLAVLVIGGATLIMFGDRFADWLAAQLNAGTTFKVIWGIIDYLIGLALLFLGLEVIYYFGPHVEQDWKWLSAGSAFAVVSIIITSLLFSLYLRVGPSYSATYGGIGAVIILMLWLYLMGAVILIGGEINAELSQNKIEHSTQKGSSGQPCPA
jgi:membrane protein